MSFTPHGRPARRLRAAAEPTRLRLLALAARGAFCVTEFTEILGQSQPRLSRHLKLLCDSGLLERVREGANAWFALPTGPDGAVAANWSPACRPTIPSWKPTAARPPASWPSAPASPPRASAARAPSGTKCAPSICRPPPSKPRCSRLSPKPPPASLLDIGTGTGRVLELLAPRMRTGAWRGRLEGHAGAGPGPARARRLAHCAVRLADMYRLPLADAGVRHRRAANGAAPRRRPRRRAGRGRTRAAPRRPPDRHRPGAHDRADIAGKLAHRWPGFTDATMQDLLPGAGMAPQQPLTVAGPLAIRVWAATRVAAAAAAPVRSRELAI